jgi:hypothetical protein
MCNEDIDVADIFVLGEFEAEWAQSCPGIENENVLTATHLDAGCVASIANRRWTGTGDASADSPKPNAHR